MRFSYDVLDDTEKILFALRSLYQQHGYRRYRMGKFEEYDLYSSNKDFLVSDGVITFTDTDGKLLALKPDVTLSIIKNTRDRQDLQKLCYNETVYRISKGTGTFREIMQTGLECMGPVDAACVGEVLRLAAESLALPGRDYTLNVSHLGVLTELVDGATGEEAVRRELTQCVSEKNLHGIAAVCRRTGIPAHTAEALTKLAGLQGRPAEILPILRNLAKSGGAEELARALAAFDGTDAAEHIRVDFSVVGNRSYYNGVIFQGFLEGIPESVLSGGQYDNLMGRMGRKNKAVGFAVYLDLLDRLEARAPQEETPC